MLSVIIPSYNRADLLPRALDSVLQQTLPESLDGLEVTVVDDGSSDGTEELIRQSYSQVIYIKQANQGVSAARNRGIELATGQWIALLDSDDQWLPNKLLEQFEQLHKTKHLICHTDERWIRNGVRVNQMKKHQKQGGWIFQQCLPLCVMSPSSIVLHRKVIDRVGLFDESLPACEDYDLWLRITAHYPVSYVAHPCLVKYGGHADQLSRQHWGMDRFRVIALEKILRQSVLSDDNRTAAIAMLTRKLEILLKGACKHHNQSLIDQCEEKLLDLKKP